MCACVCACAWLQVWPLYYDLAPGDEVVLNVAFEPKSMGLHTEKLIMVCDNCQVRCPPPPTHTQHSFTQHNTGHHKSGRAQPFCDEQGTFGHAFHIFMCVCARVCMCTQVKEFSIQGLASDVDVQLETIDNMPIVRPGSAPVAQDVGAAAAGRRRSSTLTQVRSTDQPTMRSSVLLYRTVHVVYCVFLRRCVRLLVAAGTACVRDPVRQPPVVWRGGAWQRLHTPCGCAQYNHAALPF